MRCQLKMYELRRSQTHLIIQGGGSRGITPVHVDAATNARSHRRRRVTCRNRSSIEGGPGCTTTGLPQLPVVPDSPSFIRFLKNILSHPPLRHPPGFTRPRRSGRVSGVRPPSAARGIQTVSVPLAATALRAKGPSFRSNRPRIAMATAGEW